LFAPIISEKWYEKGSDGRGRAGWLEANGRIAWQEARGGGCQGGGWALDCGVVTEQAERHYRGEAGRRYQLEKRAIPEAAIPWVARLRAEKISPHVRPSDVVLEYGAGFGWNLARLECGRRLAFDLADYLSPSIRASGVEFVADTKSIAGASLDVAVCHHTLEHVIHPVAVLEEIRRMLRPEGKLLLFVPYERERKYRRFDPAEPNHHLYSWNAQTLGNLAREAGFGVVEAGTGQFGYDRFAAVWAGKLGLGEGGFRGLRGLLHIMKPAREVRIVAAKASKLE
jgi:SAM-dependent methyltransferase